MTGAKGSPPSHDYKVNSVSFFHVLETFCIAHTHTRVACLKQVCATYMDGYRATAVCPVGGPRAAEKARRTAESIIKRWAEQRKRLHPTFVCR